MLKQVTCQYRAKTMKNISHGVCYIISSFSSSWSRRKHTHVLRRLFVPKSDEIIGGLRKQYHEELQKFRASPNIITIVKSRIMRWVGHVAYIGETTNAYRVLLGNNKERDH
jgi:hypothetical protein